MKKIWPPKFFLRFRENRTEYKWIDVNGKIRTRAYKHEPPKDSKIMSDEELEKRN